MAAPIRNGVSAAPAKAIRALAVRRRAYCHTAIVAHIPSGTAKASAFGIPSARGTPRGNRSDRGLVMAKYAPTPNITSAIWPMPVVTVASVAIANSMSAHVSCIHKIPGTSANVGGDPANCSKLNCASNRGTLTNTAPNRTFAASRFFHS